MTNIKDSINDNTLRVDGAPTADLIADMLKETPDYQLVIEVADIEGNISFYMPIVALSSDDTNKMVYITGVYVDEN